MITRQVTIASAVGLHARPAALFVEQVKATGHAITIGKPGGKTVKASSVLGVLSLGAKHGETVVLAAEDPAAGAALDRLAAFLEIDHDSEA
ncbi:HPr family phosphocarrier protein [Tessaracoccus sp. OH4464_COT-324]|uniref:HPr family phosphocarrier protein n=1 Tax=Tessaracoccus sp. OH4464_COT-324 TaxID=2491059 RepID=UPI000F62CF87|nr:HPr family phosphocarrier protein [Tessaracoccus sp. OH4464_COT-324]RRD45823.1 HPr family phosphocarrier protein [Tessaracoccus sp. OH4464_COT-324]